MCLVCVCRVIFEIKSTKTCLVCFFLIIVLENCVGERVLKKVIDLMGMTKRVILESR